MANKILSHPLSHVLLILALGLLAYANSFAVPFVFDDDTSILHNPIIQNIGNFAPGGAGYQFIPRRVFGYFTFALNYYYNGLDVTGYHMVNLVIHLCSALLAYALVKQTFRTPALAESSLVPKAGTVALLAALLFAVHPVQTQAVTYIVQRLTSLATLLYLLSLVCYVQARLRLQNMASATTEPAKHGAAFPAVGVAKWHVALLLGGSVVAAILAMKTKEIAFTLPLAVLLYESSFFSGEWRRRLLIMLPLLLTLLLIPYGVMTAGDGASLQNGAAGLEHELRAHTDLPRGHYLLTQFRVIVTYLRLLVLPVGQNVDYDFPVFTTFFTPPVFLSFALLAALFLLAIFLYRASAMAGSQVRSARPELRLVAFGIVWFFLALSVESSLVPIADLLSEHRLYLPSIGMATAMATLVMLAAEKSAHIFNGRIPLLAAAVVILALTSATWQRNQVWGSQLSLWEDVVRKSPDKARPRYNLGTYLMGAGKVDEALRALSLAVTLDPEYAEAWHNLGLAHLMAGHYESALYPLRQAVRLDPEMDNAAVNLAIALIYTNQPRDAVPSLERLRERLPERTDLRYNLGLAYIGVGDLEAARRELEALERLAPDAAAGLAVQIEQAAAKTPAK